MREPKRRRLKRVQSRISPESWEKRVAEAKKAEEFVLEVEALVKGGSSLNTALAKVGAGAAKRSSLLRWVTRYRADGLEGLIDARTPREPKLTEGCRRSIEALRQTSPRIDAETVATRLEEQGVTPLPSKSSIKKQFRLVDARQKYARAKGKEREDEVVILPLAGGELLLAAELETGVMAAVTDEVVAIGKEAKEAAGDAVPAKDTKGRDRKGHFTVAYNTARRRKPGEEIAPYLRSAATKAAGRVPSWPRFVHEDRSSIAPKIEALTLSWGLAETKGWDALRAPSMAGLEPLTGYAYMPSTLAKMVSALAMSGAGDRMLQAVGLRWHHEATRRWGERGAIAALYVDNHAKEVWSSKYTLSGKVSHLSRVMPCITTTYVHTGAGAPIVASVQSGGAPLAPRLLQIVERTEALLDEEIRRAVIIDAEGSTFDVLEGFVKSMEDKQKSRIIVTPLRPSRAPELAIRHGQGSQFRPYRDNDELRIGEATLTHKSTGRTLKIGTLEVRREHRDSDTILLTNGLALGAKGKELADLYFSRWPLQENFFKEAGPVWLAGHRTNCADVVANVAVESKLERLGRQREAVETKIADLEKGREALQAKARTAADEWADASTDLASRRKELDSLIAKGLRDGKKLGQAAVGHQVGLARSEAAAIANKRAQEKWDDAQSRRTKLMAEVDRIAKEQKKLSPLVRIRQLDVEPDKILTATKLALAMLISFALREYLPTMAMAPQTFLARVMCLQGRREVGANKEAVIFYENSRDPEVNEALRAACEILNKRALQRESRTLTYRIARPPEAGVQGGGEPM
jgi:transposase